MRVAWIAIVVAACSPTEKVTGNGCESCHRPEGAASGAIEIPHASFALTCVDCHGGNAEGRTVADAHVQATDGTRDLRGLASRQLDAVGPAVLRFVDPGDLRVAAISCGASNAKAGGAGGCHQGIVDTSRSSVHATLVGLVNVPRFNASIRPVRPPSLGVVSATDVGFDAVSIPYIYRSLEGLTLRDISAADPSDAKAFLDHALEKQCSGCHLGLYGGPGEGRSGDSFGAGCTACHMVYENDALSRSEDPFADRAAPGHPAKHVIERSVPDRQCEHCHSRSYRIGTAFKGWRERTAADEGGLRNAEVSGEAMHGRATGFYVIDEDTRDSIDLTPPDVHQVKGLGCVDCHMAAEAHGDGHIHASMAGETTIECEDCHGTFSKRAGETGDGGLRTSGGAPIPRLRRDAAQVVLTGALDGREHVVPQLVDLRASTTLDAAHSAKSHGELECYACHTAWMQNFYRVDRTLDLRSSSVDPLEGRMDRGIVREENRVASIGDLYLGTNPDGKIGTFMVENSIFSVVAPCDPRVETSTCVMDRDDLGFGKPIVDRFVGRSPENRLGLTWMPAFAHTTANRVRVQPCERCHSRLFEVNEARVRATYGFGGRRAIFIEPATGAELDLSQMIAPDGTPVVALGHLLTGPVDADRIQRAVNVKVSP